MQHLVNGQNCAIFVIQKAGLSSVCHAMCLCRVLLYRARIYSIQQESSKLSRRRRCPSTQLIDYCQCFVAGDAGQSGFDANLKMLQVI